MRMLIAALVAVITGCATPIHPDVARQAETPLACKNKTECDLFWQRTQVGIAKHADWRIQTATDVVIQTFGPGAHSPSLAYMATRQNNSDGSGRISINANCDNMFGCQPARSEGILRVKGCAEFGC
jgi:hypothetical protein